MADHEVVAPMTLIIPFPIVVVAPMTLIVPFTLIVLVPPMTLIAPLQIIVEAAMTLIYSLPIVECSVDDDCPIGYVCENGVCVLENGNGNGELTGWERFQKWVEENWMVVGGGTLVASAVIIGWPKGEKK